MAVFDAAFLVYLFDPDANTPQDPETGAPITYFRERIEHLVSQLERSNEKIIIPAPALSEYLVRADEAGAERLHYLQNQGVFQIVEFGVLAAVELAALTREAISKGDKKSGVDAPWQQVKIDRQIVAIAKVARETRIYSGDSSLHAFAKQAGLEALGVADLDVPPEDAQGSLRLDPPGADPSNE
ncbi:MAG: hypothetical protein JJU22_11335 [Gammaproteobacteria bacterium]|nr:hypothetical protein [Gammaproteobacteria bacterium]